MPEDSSADGCTTLERDVGPEVYQELLCAFLEHLSIQLHDLRQAAEAADVPAAKYIAHQIKGTATSFGAARLDELAVVMLQMDHDQDELLISLVDDMGTEIANLQGVVHV